MKNDYSKINMNMKIKMTFENCIKYFRELKKEQIYFYFLSLINLSILLVLMYSENKIVKNIVDLGIVSASGIIAAQYTYLLSQKGNIKEKRRDKYFKHRNTLVQLEHELIPARIDIGNNIKAFEDAIENTGPNKLRLILKMNKIDISTGLSLNLLDLEIINDYSKLYVLIKKINSDISYLDILLNKIQEGQRSQDILDSYKLLQSHMLSQLRKIDDLGLDLLIKCQLIFKQDDEKLSKIYEKTEKLFGYDFDKKEIDEKKEEITNEETRPPNPGEEPDKNFLLYLDINRTI